MNDMTEADRIPNPPVTGGESGRRCLLCGSAVETAFRRYSRLLRRDFTVKRCNACRFAFVDDPCLDYASIYNEAYYKGLGADPLVRYYDELDHPERSLRRLEWEGIASWVRESTVAAGMPERPAILDYGCGNGRLAWHLTEHGYPGACGWDVGWIADEARKKGMPILDAFPAGRRFDIILAVEVIEHAADPLAMLSEMRSVLRPGGLLLLTTGNADPWWDKLEKWRYAAPEIHLSLFTPNSLALAMSKTGFKAERHSFTPAWKRILRYKILKNLGVENYGLAARLSVLSPGPCLRLVDKLYGVTAMPHGTAIE